MRIGIFGGSFDPVHIEHVRLVESALRSLALDKLIVVPACKPPHKQGKTLSADSARLQACRLAFSGIEKAQVSDFEILQGGTSYTYLTCRHFQEQYQGAQLFFIVGTDMLRDFPTWKNTDEILKTVTLAVVARAEQDGWLQTERAKFKQKFNCDFAVVDYHGKDVSSTKIRVLAGAGEDVTPFVGDKVAAFIQEQGLYAVAGAKDALALEKPHRKEHSLRVAEVSAKKAVELGIPEQKAITAALFHDCGKNVKADSALLSGFDFDKYASVPSAVLHQFTGAYLAQTRFGVTDEEVLDAIKFHCSGKAEMSKLAKIVYLADMVEDERDFAGVETLRKAFYEKGDLDKCLLLALEQAIAHVKEKGGDMYPLTLQAYTYYKEKEYGKQTSIK